MTDLKALPSVRHGVERSGQRVDAATAESRWVGIVRSSLHPVRDGHRRLATPDLLLSDAC